MPKTPDKRLKLGELLVDAGLISAAQLGAALGEQRRWGNRLGVTLVRMGFLEEEDLVRALAVQLALPVVRLRGKRVAPEALELVPAELAEKHRCLPLFLKDEGSARILSLALEDPVDLEALDALSFRLGVKVRPVLIAPSELDDALHRHYHWELVGLSGGELDETGGDDEVPELEVVEQVRPAPSDPALAVSGAAGAGRGVGAEAILRALTQLLVEKGVFTREELVARISSLAGSEG